MLSPLTPIRLRVAIAGLDAIRDRLTPAAYDALGGLPGLEAAYINRQISTSEADPDEVFRLLTSFILNQGGLIKTRRGLLRTDLPPIENFGEGRFLSCKREAQSATGPATP